jgi:MoxR-like ATPase
VTTTTIIPRADIGTGVAPGAAPENNAGFYIADPALIVAAQVAMELGQPLLLTGEPGTGKSTFADYMAAVLAPEWFAADMPSADRSPLEVRTFSTKSSSSATDLFYRYDSLRRFQAGQPNSGMSNDNRDYLSFEALGRALLETLPADAPTVQALLRDLSSHAGPRRSVVLIDEIDKAPRDFPNDILTEIDKWSFEVPEVQTAERRIARVEAARALLPVVVLTSNSEKNLPAAFLRRCVFHHIGFPDRDTRRDRLVQIVRANIAQATGRLAEQAIDFFYDVRALPDVEKPPATAELVAWIRWLQAQARRKGLPADAPLGRLEPAMLKASLGVLAKNDRDLLRAQALVDRLPAR